LQKDGGLRSVWNDGKAQVAWNDGKTQTEMISNAAVIAKIGELDTTSPFSSRIHPDLGKDRDIFKNLTDSLFSSKNRK
jgi:hypothetical protein